MTMTDKQRAMRKVQAAAFALVEANLYLDSHPTCPQGFGILCRAQKAHEKAVKEYEEKVRSAHCEGF